MAAYASLLSLARTLHQILNLDSCNSPIDREGVVSLLAKVNFIVNFLEDCSEKHCGTIDPLGNGMRKAAYEAQDFMDSYLCSVSSSNFYSSSSDACDDMSVDQNINLALERVHFFWEKAMKIKNRYTAEDLRTITYSSPVEIVKTTDKTMFVGFDDDLHAIKERLYEDSARLQIIPIVGMGGIGKTTLARRAYEDSLPVQYFDICAWITVSQVYQRTEILSRLLKKVKQPGNESSDGSEAQLAKLVYQNLVGRRYLIVIDDIWSTNVWDYLKMIFTDDSNGSRILLTTRLSDVAVYARSSSTPLHQMNFLNEDQSWKLFREKIFGQESCPLQLVDIGKKIAGNCRGLPLMIVVVAGLLLSSGDVTKEELWKSISERISSTEPLIAQQCSKILCLSYDWLPLRLKPCFLYIAAFPEDYKIDVSKLIKLWVAEGFLKPGDQSKCLEDVGELYLEDLVNRNLILVSQKGPDGKLEFVKIHDLLREICITKAEEEGFLHHVSPIRNTWRDASENPNRRLSIHNTEISGHWPIQDSNLRSVLLFSERDVGPRLSISCRNLTILDALQVTWPKLSDVISTFFNLRYIAFDLNQASCPHGFPASISKLPNLESIIAHVKYSKRVKVPYEILKMPKLRHLIMDSSFRISFPSTIGIVHESDLQTLNTVLDFRFTEDAIKTLVNLKKLKVVFDMDCDNWDDFNLNNLFHLQNLEELLVSVVSELDFPNPSVIWNHAFPISLKKLTLIRVPLPWENMTIIGSLPNLQVLVMMSINVDEVSEWTPMEGQFLRLKYFHSSLDYLVKWEVEKEHFPSLESLVLKHAKWIDEIPCGIGEIDTLQLIELHDCWGSLVNSAKQIQDQQRENGNDSFQVRVINSYNWF